MIATATRISLSCHDCSTVFRIDLPIPVVAEPFKFCPMCGNVHVYPFKNPEADYWEVMAESFSLPVEFVKALYDMWTADPDSPSHFRTYVTNLRNRTPTKV